MTSKLHVGFELAPDSRAARLTRTTGKHMKVRKPIFGLKSMALGISLLASQHAIAATFLAYVDNYSEFQSQVGTVAKTYTEDFSSATSGTLVSPDGTPDTWNGFSVSVYGHGTPVWGPSTYQLSLSSAIWWNASTPGVPGIYGSVGSEGGTDLGISFRPSSSTIAGFSFDFVDWNDEGQRSKFVIFASDDTQTVVTGPSNDLDKPPQNFAVTLSAEDIAAGKYITEIRLINESGESEVVGFYNFRFLTNPVLDPNSFVLSATSAMGNFGGRSAAGVIDNAPNLLALFIPISSSGDATISNAVSQTLPLLTGGSIGVAQGALSGINRVIQARLDGNNSGMSSGNDFYGDKHVWFKPFGSRADQNDRNGVSGYKAKTHGLIFGVDGTINPATRLGAAFTYAKSDINGNSSVAPQSADISVYQLIGYGSYNLAERTEINFQADFGRNTNKGKRQIAFTSTTATSDYASFTGHLGIGLGHTYPLSSQTNVTPSVRADYTRIKDKAYTENGAGLLNLSVGSHTTEALVISANGKFAHHLNDQTTLTANLGVGYDTVSKQSAITAAFAGAPGASFVTYGVDPSPWIGRAGVGAVYKTKAGLELTARYDAEYRESFLNQTASIKARWAF
jgi:outer membrane autotransporter protein